MRVINIDERNYQEAVKKVLKRNEESFSLIDMAVENIISEVKDKGDEALRSYTERFDGAQLDEIRVQADEINEALKMVGNDFIQILEEAKRNIWD